MRKPEQARKAVTAISNAPGQVEQMDLSGLVDLVIKIVWKRLSLPAREAVSRSEDVRSGRPSGAMHVAHPADMPL